MEHTVVSIKGSCFEYPISSCQIAKHLLSHSSKSCRVFQQNKDDKDVSVLIFKNLHLCLNPNS